MLLARKRLLELRKNINDKMEPFFPEDWDPNKMAQMRRNEQKPTDLKLLQKAMDYTAELDRLRNENFKITFPELWNELRDYVDGD